MALKPDRDIKVTEVNLVFNGTAEAGTIMTYSTAGSGNATPDDKAGVVVVGPAASSGALPAGTKVAGLLINPFVTFDPLLHRNIYKVTQYPGEKATLLRQGWVTTNVMASGGVVPDAGRTAYLGTLGGVTDASTNSAPKVGEFMSRLDENGYCRLAVQLPN